MVTPEQYCCSLCRISSVEGALGAILLYLVQDFERRGCLGAILLYLMQDFERGG